MIRLREKIIGIAKRLGIHLIGFTNVEDFDELKPILLERKARGYLSGFEEEDILRRIRPLQIFPEAKSIISIGLSYHHPSDKPAGGELYGRISKIAWGRDYHFILKEKMEALMKAIGEEIMPMKYMAFADTGPLVDRGVAHRAGLGNYGKNGFIIHRDYGSFFVIGNILVDREIEIDQRLGQDICGDCTKCIRACPTGALEGPFSFNAQKCISYITQKKGILGDEERQHMGNHIYGCDICQMVCPYNRKARTTDIQDFKPHPNLAYPKLPDLLKMTNSEFRQTYGFTSAGWRGKKVLQRNAIIALGNSRKRDALPLLRGCLKDARWEIRLYAIWALFQCGEEGRRMVQDWLEAEDHPEVLKEIERLNL